MALGLNCSKVHTWGGVREREEGRKRKGRGLRCVRVVLTVLEMFEGRESLRHPPGQLHSPDTWDISGNKKSILGTFISRIVKTFSKNKISC